MQCWEVNEFWGVGFHWEVVWNDLIPLGPWSHCYRLVEHQRVCPQLLRVNSVTGRNKVKHGKGQSFHTSDLLKSSCKWSKTSWFFIACPKLYVFFSSFSYPFRSFQPRPNHFQSLHLLSQTHITSKSWHLVALFPPFLGCLMNLPQNLILQTGTPSLPPLGWRYGLFSSQKGFKPWVWGKHITHHLHILTYTFFLKWQWNSMFGIAI